MRLMTLNLAHGRNAALHQALVPRRSLEANLARIAAAIRREKPDVVAVQEADGPSAWSGNFDHVETLRELAGMAHGFHGVHGSIQVRSWKAGYGTALLSRQPLREAESRCFDLSWRDDKGYVRALVDAPGLPGLEVISVHLDYIRPAMRRKQAARMIDELASYRGPRIVMGDFNCGWRGTDRCVISMLEKGLGLTAWKPDQRQASFPSFRPMTRIDWILASPGIRFHSYATMPDRISDHLAVIADIG
jgi:endonuclease/exonuclease/phosphatase family metal-dependent hydrolase